MKSNRPRIAALAVLLAWCATATAQVRLGNESDRLAFRLWFAFIADSQFYRPTPDVVDCAALVRHAVREALRPHSPEWARTFRLPFSPGYGDVSRPPKAGVDGWPLFHVGGNRYAEFADAATIVRFNARRVGMDPGAARQGDLLYFHQPDQSSPDHLMVFVGDSIFERAGSDWVVYHTGPGPEGPGEVRKVRVADLEQHPSPRWRPRAGNDRFVGVFRLAFL
jgi:uncharacterized protein YfaT (DUF1175 family)